MSRIGKQPIAVPDGVQVQIEPPDDFTWFRTLKDSGAEALGLHLEVWDEEVLARVAPGKHARTCERRPTSDRHVDHRVGRRNRGAQSAASTGPRAAGSSKEDFPEPPLPSMAMVWKRPFLGLYSAT